MPLVCIFMNNSRAALKQQSNDMVSGDDLDIEVCVRKEERKQANLFEWMVVVVFYNIYRMDADRMAPKRKSMDSLYTDCSR